MRYLGRRIYLIKVRLPNKTYAVFATNLTRSTIKKHDIAKLYRLRWEIETSFKEITAITKAEQWHTEFYNGILQELYCRMWLINLTRSLMAKACQGHVNFEEDTYSRANFKLICSFITDNLQRLWKRLYYLFTHIKDLARKSTEKRKKYSRKYRRIIRYPNSPYKRESTEWYWQKKQELK